MMINYCLEGKEVSVDQLKETLNIIDDTVLIDTIKELELKKILFQKENGLYYFNYVGVVIFEKTVLFVLPKYISNNDFKSTAKQLLVLLNEYSKREKLDKEEIESFGCIDSAIKLNLLGVIVFLIEDYLTNGLYSNEKGIYVLNGDDDIEWQKTIADFQPIINNGRPIYIDYYTYSTQNDDEDYFRRLHKYVLSQCTIKLAELNLDDFFGFDDLNYYINEESLGYSESILHRIDMELSVQFSNRKQLLLKAIYAFISSGQMLTDNDKISFYGSKVFENVWEKACAYILDNKYASLAKHIAKPIWKNTVGTAREKRTLIPDIISVSHQKTNIFFISDAKYYLLFFSDLGLYGNPGIEDVTKQYLYQLAFSDYIERNNYELVLNAFLFPSENVSIEYLGSVTISFLKNLGLEDIQLIRMPAPIVFDMYINNNKFDLEEYMAHLLELMRASM